MSMIPNPPTIGTSGDYAADREPLHYYIRMMNNQIDSISRAGANANPKIRIEVITKRDEAQKSLDNHAVRYG